MEPLGQFAELLDPEEAIEPILAAPVRGALMEWLTEIWARAELEAVGLKPRDKALFFGAPGVGKTTLAHHLAARLGLRLAVVRAEALQESYVSASARNIGRLFAAVRKHGEPVVLFFDEFESLAQKRMQRGQNPAAEADHNHTVNTLLSCFDRHAGLVIAASNQADGIDPAIWRRFEIHVELALPGQSERRRILARYLAPYGLPRDALDGLAEAFETASPALMRQFAEGLKRQLVVGPKVGWNMDKLPTIERLLAAIAPHPDLGKPRLWSLGAADAGVRGLPWPLPRAEEILEDREAGAAVPVGDVIAFPPARRAP